MDGRIPRLGLLLLALAFLPACHFKAGVGDPSQAKVDPALSGYWVLPEGATIFHLVPTADGRTYDVKYFAAGGTLAAPTKKDAFFVKGQAWLTMIGETRFATFKVTEPEFDVPFSVFKVGSRGDNLTLAPLNQDFEPFRIAKTTAAMESAVKENLKNPDAFQDKGVFRRSSAEATAAVRALFGEMDVRS